MEDVERLGQVLEDYGRATLATVRLRNAKWGDTWNEMRNEGLEDHIHIKAHRLCNCPEGEKRECLIDLLAYAVKRWERRFE